MTSSFIAILALSFGSIAVARNSPTPPSPYGASGTPFLRGDATGDGKVDGRDYHLLTMYVIAGGNISVPVIEALDVVNDGKIDGRDVAAFPRQYAEGTLGHEWGRLDYMLGVDIQPVNAQAVLAVAMLPLFELPKSPLPTLPIEETGADPAASAPGGPRPRDCKDCWDPSAG